MKEEENSSSSNISEDAIHQQEEKKEKLTYDVEKLDKEVTLEQDKLTSTLLTLVRAITNDFTQILPFFLSCTYVIAGIFSYCLRSILTEASLNLQISAYWSHCSRVIACWLVVWRTGVQILAL